ncbi:MAG: thiol-activated cytolysin family protein [Rubrivivax sp.]|nr:thiol-activated cytolysin family protein [Rubrivivax sp.]
MSARSALRAALAAATCVAMLAACGGGGDPAGPNTPLAGDPGSALSTDGNPPADAPVGTYLRLLPRWADYSPPKPAADKRIGEPVDSTERVEGVPVVVGTGSEARVVGYRSEDYACTTTKFRITDTPEKIVMLSPDRELMWPGAMIQGRSHRDGLGSLLPLVVRERAPIKVSIPSLATSDNFRLVAAPDQAEVNQAIGSMIANANTDRLTTPSSIQFTMQDFASEESFALKAGMSGRYMGFSASASASVSTSANERTVMVHFVEKMFEVVVEPPQSPGAFFAADFTRDKLDEQIAMGRIGPDNPPVYVANVVYGRLMTFAFTSSASTSEIKAALNAAYSGIFKASVSLSAEHERVLREGKVVITSLGGDAAATLAMIQSGDWKQYFSRGPTALTTAYPLSYTLRNLGDGSIAQVSETTSYDVRQCTLKDAYFSGFVLDSFETPFTQDTPADKKWTATAASPLAVSWGEATTPQSIFYGYLYARHTNQLADDLFKYDVGYVHAPAHFLGDKTDFYKGELSFWFKPDEKIHMQKPAGRFCYLVWYLFWAEQVCVSLPAPIANPDLRPTDRVLAYDQITTFDQVVLRGGGNPDSDVAVLTLTYNPKESQLPNGWSRRAFALTNSDLLGNTRCERDGATAPWRNCWLLHDQPATEQDIRYVLAHVRELRLRASYPVTSTRKICQEPAPAPCVEIDSPDPIPFGYVGGYFDEVQLSKRSPGL